MGESDHPAFGPPASLSLHLASSSIHRTSYRPISLLCPCSKVPESLLLHTINRYLLHAADHHGFRPEDLTTSVLLQLTTDISMGFNQMKPPDRTACVAVDLPAAFDTVCHNNLLSEINRSQLTPATACWFSCFIF